MRKNKLNKNEQEIFDLLQLFSSNEINVTSIKRRTKKVITPRKRDRKKPEKSIMVYKKYYEIQPPITFFGQLDLPIKVKYSITNFFESMLLKKKSNIYGNLGLEMFIDFNGSSHVSTSYQYPIEINYSKQKKLRKESILNSLDIMLEHWQDAYENYVDRNLSEMIIYAIEAEVYA